MDHFSADSSTSDCTLLQTLVPGRDNVPLHMITVASAIKQGEKETMIVAIALAIEDGGASHKLVGNFGTPEELKAAMKEVTTNAIQDLVERKKLANVQQSLKQLLGMN
jgi:hypothetical protein